MYTKSEDNNGNILSNRSDLGFSTLFVDVNSRVINSIEVLEMRHSS